MKEMLVAFEEVVRCPVCLEKLRPPVLSCENGHGTCYQCKGRFTTCSLCSAAFSNVPMRILEQILQLLPEPCPYTDNGCSSMTTVSHSQYCEYRPIKCVIGTDNDWCKWSGIVRGWVGHVNNAHKDYVVKFGNTNESLNLNYINVSSWAAFNLVYYFKNNYFIVFTSKKNYMLHVAVRHVPLKKPSCQYYLETIIKEEYTGNVLYKVLQSANQLFLGIDSFGNNSTCFSFEDLKGAVVHNNLRVFRKFVIR